jgi:O-antigen/teichoic acid export membrane protein
MPSSSPDTPFSHRIAKAGALTVAGKLVCRGFDLITLMVLSRFLTPADFGLTALAMISVTIAETVTALPLGAALLRVPEPTKPMYDTAFTLGFLRGVLLAVVLGAMGFVMMSIYNEPRLVALVAALSIAPVMRSLLSPLMIKYTREMNYWPSTWIEIAGKGVALVVACAVAFSTHSYWAIAATTITTPLVINILSYWVAPYRPRLCLAEWKMYKGYVGWNSLTQLIGTLSWQMDRLLLGYFVPKADLGRYTMAADLANMPMQAVVVPFRSPVLVTYSARGTKERDELALTYLKTSSAMLTLAGPIFVLLAILAVPSVRLVLGPNWLEAAEILQWISWIVLLSLPIINLDELALALDKAQMITWRTALSFCVAMPTLFLGSFYYGVIGVIAARFVNVFFGMAVSMEAVRRLIGCPMVDQLVTLRRPALALAAMGLSLLALRPMIVMEAVVPLIFSLALVAGAGVIVYLVTLFLLWHTESRPTGIETVVWEKGRVFLAQAMGWVK